MKPKISIRRANLKDINKIYSLGKNTEEVNFSKKMKFHDRCELKEFATRTKDNILLVAFVDEDFAGFLYAKIISKTWCILDNLIVSKPYREHGIGTMMLDSLYNILKKQKVSYVQILEEIHHKNTRRFWQDKGFKEEKVFVWADKIIK